MMDSVALFLAGLDLANHLIAGKVLLMSCWPRKMTKGGAQWREDLPVHYLHRLNHASEPAQSHQVPQTPFPPYQPTDRYRQSGQDVTQMST
jgi:hypothetical protein